MANHLNGKEAYHLEQEENSGSYTIMWHAWQLGFLKLEQETPAIEMHTLGANWVGMSLVLMETIEESIRSIDHEALIPPENNINHVTFSAQPSELSHSPIRVRSYNERLGQNGNIGLISRDAEGGVNINLNAPDSQFARLPVTCMIEILEFCRQFQV